MLILEQMQAIREQQALATQALSQEIKGVNAHLQELERKYAISEATVKRVQQELEKLLKDRPYDPKTEQAIVEAGIAEAKEQNQRKRETLIKRIRKLPRGTVINDEGRTIRLMINGLPWDFKPGVNKNVPTCFIEQWEKRKHLKAWAAEIEQSLSGHHPANKVARVLGKSLAWHPETGAIR